MRGNVREGESEKGTAWHEVEFEGILVSNQCRALSLKL